jgi:signal transduction histidine kinase
MERAGALSPEHPFERRLGRVFLRFAALTSLVYGLFIFVAVQITEEFLLRRYLAAVTDWAVAELDRASDASPAEAMPRRLRSLVDAAHGGARRPALPADLVRLHVRGSPDLPAWAPGYGPGTHRHLGDGSMIRVAPFAHGQDTLYAVIDGDSLLDIDQIQPYLLLALLLIGAVVSVLGGFTGAVLARQLARPLATLTQEVDAHGDGPAAFSGVRRADEIGALSRGFTKLVDRLSGFLRREREFTRFASHELRTPVTVFKTSLSLLQATDDPALRERAIARMARSADDMEALVATFLALGREDSVAAPAPVRAARLADDIGRTLQGLSPVIRQRGLDVRHEIDAQMQVTAAEGLLAVLVENLLRNAVAYAGSWIAVRAWDRSLEIRNDVAPGSRSSATARSTGYGLQIVSRICEHEGWKIACGREGGEYTTRVTFEKSGG